jgi:hypothetical protein
MSRVVRVVFEVENDSFVTNFVHEFSVVMNSITAQIAINNSSDYDKYSAIFDSYGNAIGTVRIKEE